MNKEMNKEEIEIKIDAVEAIEAFLKGSLIAVRKELKELRKAS